MEAKRYDVDIICQHSKDGTIIPLRIRVDGDDGEPRVFKIDSYKELSGNGTMRGIRLYFRENENNWFITA